MSKVWCLISDVWCQISNVRRLMCCCQTSNVRCQSSDVRCLISDVWCRMFDVWCQMYDVWCEMSDFWCLMSYAKVEQKFLLAAIRYRDNLPHRLRVVQFLQSPRWLFWILIPFTFHLPWWSCKNTKIRLRLLGNAQKDMFEWTCQLRLFEKQIFTKEIKVTFFLTTKRTLEWCSTLTHLQFRHHLHTCYKPCLNVLRNGLKL